MKTLLCVISALALFAGYAAGQFPIDWCQQRDLSRNFVQYVANPNNKTEYYQCEKVRGKVVAYKQSCQRCFEFSDDLWTCTFVGGIDCPTEAPITEIITYDLTWCYVKGNGPAGLYLQPFRPSPNGIGKYIWDIGGGAEVEMPCPEGTYFSFDPCRCIWCDDTVTCPDNHNNRVFTLDFDNKGSENGIYYNSAGSNLLSSINFSPQYSLQLNGISGDLEVPFFQNNEFREFTFIGHFYRFSGYSSGEEGILYNGGKPVAEVPEFRPPSIYVLSTSPTQLKVGIRNDKNEVFEFTSSTVVAEDQWVSLILRYNGKKLELWVNSYDNYESIDASGVTDRLKDDLKFGLSYDAATGYPYRFKGLLDDLSWYRVAIDVPVVGKDLPPSGKIW